MWFNINTSGIILGELTPQWRATIKNYYRDQNECGEAMNKSLIRNKEQIIAKNPKTRTLDCWIKVTSKNQNSNNISNNYVV